MSPVNYVVFAGDPPVELVGFPDAEAVVVAYLKGVLPGVKVSTLVPNPRPDRLVRVTRTGGSRRNVAQDDAMVTLECWDKAAADAAALANRVRAHLTNFDTVDGYMPRDGEVSGPQFFPDPLTTNPRYQLTVIVRLRARLLEA